MKDVWTFSAPSFFLGWDKNAFAPDCCGSSSLFRRMMSHTEDILSNAIMNMTWYCIRKQDDVVKVYKSICMPPHAMWNVAICTCPNAFSCWPFTHGSMSRWSQTFLIRMEHSQVKSLTSKLCDAQFFTKISHQSQKSAWCLFKKHSGWVLYYIWFYNYNILFLPVDLAGSIYGVTENLKMGSRAPSWQVVWWTLFTQTNGFMVLVDQDNHQWQIVFIMFLSFEDDVFGRYLAKS